MNLTQLRAVRPVRPTSVVPMLSPKSAWRLGGGRSQCQTRTRGNFILQNRTSGKVMLSAAPRQTSPRRSTMPFRRQSRQVYALTAARLSFMAHGIDFTPFRIEKPKSAGCHDPTIRLMSARSVFQAYAEPSTISLNASLKRRQPNISAIGSTSPPKAVRGTDWGECNRKLDPSR